MVTLDNQEVKAVMSMSQSNGWKYMEEFISNNIDLLKKELTNGEFDDIKQVNRIQAEIQAYEKVLNFVSSRKDKYLKEVKDG